MSEREIRARVREAFRQLDRCAGRTIKRAVLPCMLGAGLALGAAGCGERAVQDDAGASDAALVQPDSGVDSGVLPPYMGPPPQDLGADLTPPPLGAYAVPAPDLGVDMIDDPSADYAAPFPAPDGG
jgi:hypothetical protein